MSRHAEARPTTAEHPGDAGEPVRLDGITVLFAHPMGELYGSDRVLIESVLAVTQGGGRAVVVLPASGPLVTALTEAGASVRFCPTPVLRKSSLRPRGFLRLLAESLPDLRAARALLRRERPDAVYVNTVTIPLWIAAARSLRIPVLNHIHEAEGSLPRPLAAALNLPLVLANRLIANSKFSVDVLGRTSPRLAARTSVVLNGVPGPQLPPIAREELVGGIRIVYVGRLSVRKGPIVAVEALGLLSERGCSATLDLIGAPIPGLEEYEAELHERAAELGIADRVWFYGFDPSIWHHLERADVMVVPSLYNEPFGNTAVEGLLAARPVVVSDTSGLREATDGYSSARRVAPGDAVALADELEDLMRTWQTARTDARADRVRAVQRHAPDAYRHTIASVLLDLAAPARHAAVHHRTVHRTLARTTPVSHNSTTRSGLNPAGAPLHTPQGTPPWIRTTT